MGPDQTVFKTGTIPPISLADISIPASRTIATLATWMQAAGPSFDTPPISLQKVRLQLAIASIPYPLQILAMV